MNEISVGSQLPEHRIAHVSPEAMHRMAVILRDPNQIHLDPAAVLAAGLGDRVINQGPSNVGYVMDMLLAAFPGGRIARFSAKFLANVFGGEEVVAGGEVEDVTPLDDGDLEIRCSVWLRAGEGRPALAATAWVRMPAG